MKIVQRVSAIIIGFELLGCSTLPQDKSQVSPSADQPTYLQPVAKQPSESLEQSLRELEATLGLTRSSDQLGLEEKSFDSCKHGSMLFSPCGPQHLSVLHLRIQCRDSEGTVTHVSSLNLEPLGRRNLKWKVGLREGITTTDNQGFAQIRLITPGSSKNQKLILISGKQALGLKAGEASRIIVPQDWCRKI